MANAQPAVSEDIQATRAPNICPIHNALDKRIDALNKRGIDHLGVREMKKRRLRQSDFLHGHRTQ